MGLNVLFFVFSAKGGQTGAHPPDRIGPDAVKMPVPKHDFSLIDEASFNIGGSPVGCRLILGRDVTRPTRNKFFGVRRVQAEFRSGRNRLTRRFISSARAGLRPSRFTESGRSKQN